MNQFKDVDTFLASLPSSDREQVSLLRTIILQSQSGLQEHIKWNSPSYVWEGEDRITFNVNNKEGLVKLVFHMGATRPENKKGPPAMDGMGLVAWQSDIRGLVTFTSDEDIRSKQGLLADLIGRWLGLRVE